MSENVIKEIEDVLDMLRTRWVANDLPGIRELWDADDESPLYLPEEREAPLTDWDAVMEYWQTTQAGIKRFSMRTWDVRVKPLGDDYVIAWYRMHWNGEIEGYEKPIGGENRVTATLRRTADGWRFCHLVEAPLAPLLYIQRLYEKAVDTEFTEPG